MVYVDSERCTGCGACIEACPADAIWLIQDEHKTYAEIDHSRCRQCEECVRVCPQGAIRVTAEPAIEKELILAQPEHVAVKARFPEPQPVRPAVKVLAWAGPVLVFVSREIVPRVAASLLDAWDRRASRTSSQPDRQGDWIPRPPDRPYRSGSGGAGGRRRRWRSGHG